MARSKTTISLLLQPVKIPSLTQEARQHICFNLFWLSHWCIKYYITNKALHIRDRIIACMNSTIKLHDHHKYNLIANDYLSLHIILSINALNLGSPINNDVCMKIHNYTHQFSYQYFFQLKDVYSIYSILISQRHTVQLCEMVKYQELNPLCFVRVSEL